ncbi:MAG: hypothetical protein ABSG77_07210 [Candidatus Acidiferrum sp.]|jgi:hypothetical protein
MVCCRAHFFFGAALCALALSGVSLFGQEKPDSPEPKVQASSQDATSSTASQTATQTAKKDSEAKDEVPKRIFWIIPNFMTTNDQPENKGPLTPQQKFNIAWHQFWDESAHFGNIIQAGISQAADGIPHYGEGWGAFGERYLAQEGDQFTGSFLIYGILPTMLHQDPRYFRRGRGSALSRIAYAASRVLIARTDSGKTTFNASQVFGQLGQAGISLSYYAKQDRDVHGLLVGWAVNQTYNVGWNQLKEFTPDLNALIRRHSKKKLQVPADPRATQPATDTN